MLDPKRSCCLYAQGAVTGYFMTDFFFLAPEELESQPAE